MALAQNWELLPNRDPSQQGGRIGRGWARLNRIKNRPGRCKFSKLRLVVRILALIILANLHSALFAAEPRPLAEHQVKALYLFNFTKYLEWPSNTFAEASTPLTIGIVGEPVIKDDLLEITRNKKIDGRPIVAKTIQRPEEVSSCQILFLDIEDKKRISQFLDGARELPVLTVGVSDDFLLSGGIICFAKKENNLRLKIDVTSAKRARLTISAKLLAVADRTDAQKGSH